MLLYRYYLGITDANVEGVYRTTEGFALTWAALDSNEPDGVRNQNCVFRDDGRKWDDNPCNNPLEFYCEGKKIPGLNILNPALLINKENGAISSVKGGRYKLGI